MPGVIRHRGNPTQPISASTNKIIRTSTMTHPTDPESLEKEARLQQALTAF
jgi:hypothetical protein